MEKQEIHNSRTKAAKEKAQELYPKANKEVRKSIKKDNQQYQTTKTT